MPRSDIREAVAFLLRALDRFERAEREAKEKLCR